MPSSGAIPILQSFCENNNQDSNRTDPHFKHINEEGYAVLFSTFKRFNGGDVLTFLKELLQEHHQSVKQFGSRDKAQYFVWLDLGPNNCLQR